MNKFIAYFFILFMSFEVEQALAQDSTFITDRYKWELGIGLNANADRSRPVSLLLKKHVSARTAWRFGLGINYDRVYDKDLDILLDNNLALVFIQTLYDRKEEKLFLATSAGIQKNHAFKSLNWYYSLDAILNYEHHKVDLPNGIGYLDIRMPDSTDIITAKFFTSRGYGISLRPSLGVQYSISKRLSISCETNFIGTATYFRTRDFYYRLSSFSDGNIGYGFTQEIYRYNWRYNLGFSNIFFLTINYHFD